MPKSIITGFWTFFCNPKYWPVDDFLFSNPIGTVSQYRIASWQKKYFKIGQFGVIRVGNDSRNKIQLAGKKKLERGVYAIVEVIGDVFPQKNSESAFRIEHQQGEFSRLSVPVKYIRNYILRPVLLSDIEDDVIIKRDLYLLNGIQAASMPLQEEAFNRILLYGEEKTE